MDTKTPEQIAAEQRLEAQRREAEEKAAAERLAELKAKAGEVHFVFAGEVYVPLMPRVEIPKIGILTALEICTSEEAQKYLVESGCEGTVIAKIA